MEKEKALGKKHLLRRYFPYLWKYKKTVALDLILCGADLSL